MPTTWRPVTAFFALTILFLGFVPLLSVLTGLTMDFDAAASKASAETGIEQTSNLVVVLRLAMSEPALCLLLLGSSVPALAALVVCGVTGKPSIAGLLARLNPVMGGIAWSQALRSYAALFIATPVCLIAVYGLRQVVPGGVAYTHAEGIFGPGLLVALFVSAFLDQGGVLEEVGWRGYGQPAIQTNLLSPLGAAIVLGVAWGLWHVPRDIVSGVIERLGVAQYLFFFLPSFILGTLTVSVIAAYFMNRAGGSLWPAIMVHGLTNDAVGLAGTAPLNVALTPFHQITKAIPFLVFALLLVTLSGARLGAHDDATSR